MLSPNALTSGAAAQELRTRDVGAVMLIFLHRRSIRRAGRHRRYVRLGVLSVPQKQLPIADELVQLRGFLVQLGAVIERNCIPGPVTPRNSG